MTSFGSEVVLATFVLFCRIGACLLLMPGLSSPRIPVQARLFLAIAITLALTPVLLPGVDPDIAADAPVALTRLIVSELLTGALIGLMGRIFFIALETLATGVTMAIGLGNMPGAPVEESEPLPPLVSLIMLSATILIFATEQHWEILRALVASYAALPAGEFFAARFGLSEVADRLAETFVLALRVSSPFIVYAVIVNLAVGLANRLTPQIPVYFISLPFVLAGGLFLLYDLIRDYLHLFVSGFAAWLATG
ncbi:flagellar biosynthesis protein FliR [Faunimonas sp. B44]|uniref:flagellar biosynthesis protein FliR n=1 Tax=Faunimonas sp. B44 TaxID=3461493 RepID=UPI004043F2F8